jgi:hypothetical protein
VNADLRALLRDLRRAGWRVEQGRHFRLYPPGGGPPVRVSCTPSDGRAYQNILSDLRRSVTARSPRH